MTKPPKPEHECEGCKHGMELIVPPYSSVVGQGAIHPPHGWICMKYVSPEAYAVYRRAARASRPLRKSKNLGGKS